jgi:P pilus assembly chaperone PapD
VRAGNSGAAALFVLMALTSPRAAAQSLMVGSPAVVIDDRARTGALTLINDGIAPVEVSVSTFCGYPVTDSVGQMYLRTFAAVDDTMPCAAKWIQSFPRRLRVEAKSRATIRLLVTPPAALASGEYWARLMVAAKGGQAAVGGLTDTSFIQARLDLEVRSVVGLFYRKGSPHTSVALERLRAQVQGDSLVSRALLTREGDAAFVGSLNAVLRDPAGKVRSQTRLPLGVYYTLEPRFTLPVAGLPAGSYELSVEAVSSRPDLAADLLLPTVPVQQSVRVMLP